MLRGATVCRLLSELQFSTVELKCVIFKHLYAGLGKYP